jgi:hypothetical protein
MQTYSFSHNGSTITYWGSYSGYPGGTLTECLALAAELGLTWDTVPLPEPLPKTGNLSKLRIRRQLREWGAEAAFEAVLDALPHARTDWDDAQDISTEDPIFVEHKESLKVMLGITEEQFQELLSL